MEQLSRIQLVVDGNYGRKIYDHLSRGVDGISYSIEWDKLLDYTASLIQKISGRRCVFIKKSFFIGSNQEFDRENLDYYRSLERAGVQRISFPLKSAILKDGRPSLKEDAVDTSLVFNVAKDFYTSKTEERFDWLVLVAGDGDLTPLVQGLGSEGVRVLVVYYDFSTPLGTTRASQLLLEEASNVISLENLLRERVDSAAKACFSLNDNKTLDKGYSLDVSQKITISAEQIEAAIKASKQDPEGWVLVAQLGKALEWVTGSKLPFGVKLKSLIGAYPQKFETKEIPAFSVRTLPAKKTVKLCKKGGALL